MPADVRALDPAGIRINARSVLRRLEFVLGASGPGKRLAAGGPWADLLAAEATARGWVSGEGPAPDAAVWFAPEPDEGEGEGAAAFLARHADAAAVCVIGANAPPPETHAPVMDRAFSLQQPLSFWFAPLLRAALGRRVSAAGGAFLRGTGLDKVVGGRTCGFRRCGVRERYWLRNDLPSPRREATGPGDAAADAAISVCGLGHLPLVGATAASAATVVAVGLLAPALGTGLTRTAVLGIAVAATALSLVLEEWAGKRYLTSDPREFVLDEVAGMALALSFLPDPASFAGLAAAFCAFRFFDIFKPGISWIEKRPLRGTIVWDDLLAGLYAGIALWVTARVWGGF